MADQVEIIKQVKLSSSERIAVITAANSAGVLHDAPHGVRENLRYLGLVEKSALYTKAALLERTATAWKALRAAVQSKDARAAEDAINIINSERWDMGKTVWKLTSAANEYLLKGRVIVTVGPRNESTIQNRKRA